MMTIGKTEIHLHPAVLLYLLYAAVTGHFQFMLITYLSILLHEASHAIMATYCGQPPVRIELSPLGAVMLLHDEEKLSAIKRGLVLLAGPATTLILFVFAVFLAYKSNTSPFFRMLSLCNLSILLMNMLPVLPLDGGRVLTLILGMYMRKDSVSRIMKSISVLTGLALILLNICITWQYGGWNLSLALTGCCIIYSASMYFITPAMLEMRFFLDRRILLERKRGVRTISYTAIHTIPIYHLIKLLPVRQMVVFHCSEAGTGRIIGCIHESALLQLYLCRPSLSLQEAIELQNNPAFCSNLTQSEQKVP